MGIAIFLLVLVTAHLLQGRGNDGQHVKRHHTVLPLELPAPTRTAYLWRRAWALLPPWDLVLRPPPPLCEAFLPVSPAKSTRCYMSAFSG